MTDMSNLRQAAQQALEALHNIEWHGSAGAWMLDDCKVENAIHVLRAALAEEALQRLTDVNQEIEAALAEPAQEPVAWMVYTLDGKSVCVTDNPADFTDEHRVLPLYTSPPHRKPEPVALDWLHKWANQDDGEPETQWHEGYEAARRVVQIHLTTPPQRKPLTDEEIHDCFQQKHKDKVTERRMITRAIEAAHGIAQECAVAIRARSNP